jgi:hypothetical protein
MLMLAPPGGLIALRAAACCVAARTTVHGKDTVETSSKATMRGAQRQAVGAASDEGEPT